MIYFDQNLLNTRINDFEKDLIIDLDQKSDTITRDLIPHFESIADHGKAYKAYLEYLSKNLKDIVKADKDELDTHKIEFEKMLKLPKKKGDPHKVFKDKVISTLDYEGMKKSFYHQIFQVFGISACVYCNANLTVTIQKGSKPIARYEYDHYYGKREFPGLSISFFNLIPCCGHCNKAKSSTDSPFYPYVSNLATMDSKEFSFEIDPLSRSRYLTTKNKDDLNITFYDKDQKLKTFGISEIYATQKDLAEELIAKALCYNDNYLKTLTNNFGKALGSNPALLKRLLVGNYTEPGEIHKRPMAKFTQDIARQLKLIK